MPGSTLKVPPVVTLIIGLLLTLTQVLNDQDVFVTDPQAKTYIAVALLFFGVLGFHALASGAFAAALKLPQWANTLIAAVMAAALLAITTDTGISSSVHSTVAGVLQLLGTLGFGKAGAALKARHAAAHHPPGPVKKGKEFPAVRAPHRPAARHKD